MDSMSPGCLVSSLMVLGAVVVLFFGVAYIPAAQVVVPPVPVESAGNADVTYVRAVQTGAETWTFHVTVSHPDTGWEDYADGWDVLSFPEDEVIKPDPNAEFTRVLAHPHVDESPFTRSQSGIVIPADVTLVTVRAHDLVDGWGGEVIILDLTVDTGKGFEVERQ